ncbi:hypothetical protein [Streptomyces sp. NBC_01320]|uniref:hypothetical protein n=1 Tax=Streptomyces sp. NBC_01320 TaxID=2903824 RepID=UPI002E119488|nr:hypothetical protein OG395_56355 [Streptomyces sp. NBC_01320]
MSSRFKHLPDPLLGTVSEVGGLAMHAPPVTAYEWSGALSNGVFNTKPWWEEYVTAGLPAPPAPWKARLIPAGIWLYSGTPSIQDATRVASIPVESDRMAVAVGVESPSQAILDTIAALLSVLPPDSPRAVRLLLPLLDMRVAQAFAAHHRVDLVATQGPLSLEPGRVVTSGLDDTWGEGFWQWYRVRPDRPQEPYGALHPRPAWERALTAAGRHPAVPSARIGRVAAGLTLGPLGVPDPRFVEFASRISPSADFRVIVQANGLDPLLMSACTALLRELPWETARQTQLIWPYAASAEAARQSIRELAEHIGVEITAPTAGVRLREGGGDVHGARSDGTLSPWVRFAPGEPEMWEGALLPAPAWNARLRNSLSALPTNMIPVRVESGLYLTAGQKSPEYNTLVGALVPDREAMTVFADGDAARPRERRSLQTLLDGLDPSLLPGMRLVMRSAADGGTGSFAQMLANRYRVRINVATTESLREAVARKGQAQLKWNPFRPLATAPEPVRATGPSAINASWKPAPASLARAIAKASAAQPVTDNAESLPTTARSAREGPALAPAVFGGPRVRAITRVHPIPAATSIPAATTVATPAEEPQPHAEPVVEPSPRATAESTPVADAAGPGSGPAQRNLPPPTPLPVPGVEGDGVDMEVAPNAALLTRRAPNDDAATLGNGSGTKTRSVANPPPDRAPDTQGTRPAGPRAPAEPQSAPVVSEPDPALSMRPSRDLEQAEPEPSVPIALLVRRTDRSTDAERRGWRDLIGPRRDTHLIAVNHVLAQHPALRGALPHESLNGVTSDLAALRSYLEGDLPGIEFALREQNPQIRDAAVCVASGLRMLPVHSGIAYRTAQLPASALDVYTSGATVVEPGFVAANSRKAIFGGNVLYAIWSRTARRTSVIDRDGTRDEVLFPAGAEFSVLAVEPWADGSSRLVMLDERIPEARPAEGYADEGDRLLERMRSCTSLATVGPEDLAEAPERHRLPIGLDEHNQPVRQS